MVLVDTSLDDGALGKPDVFRAVGGIPNPPAVAVTVPPSVVYTGPLCHQCEARQPENHPEHLEAQDCPAIV